MGRFIHSQNNFTSGELSPKLKARSEIAEYQQGVDELRNMLTHTHGGAYRRGGTVFQEQLSSSTYSKIRMIPFEPTNGDKLVVIMLGSSVYDWVVWYRWAADATLFGDLRNHLIPSASDIDVSEDDFADFQFMQLNDRLYLVHPSYPPIMLVHLGSSSAFVPYNVYASFLHSGFPSGEKIAEFDAWLPPNEENNYNKGSITSSANLGTVTLTSSAGVFTSAWVGARIKLTDYATLGSEQTGVVQITAYTSSTSVTAVVLGSGVGSFVPTSAVGISAGTYWEMNAWNNVNGYPRSVAAFESAVYFGGNTLYPTRLWRSEQGNIDNFMSLRFSQNAKYTSATTNDRPFDADIATSGANNIQWLQPVDGGILAGLSAQEILISGTSDTPLGALAKQASQKSGYGSLYRQPAVVGDGVVFIEKSGKKLRKYRITSTMDAPQTTEITLLADGISDNNAEARESLQRSTWDQVVFQKDTEMLWVIDTDKDLYSVTLNDEAKTLAWSRHIIAGSTTADRRDVYGFCVISNRYENREDVILQIDDEGANWNLEYIAPEYAGYAFPNQASVLKQQDVGLYGVYLDAAAYEGSKISATWGPFAHLASRTVSVVGDSQYLGEYTLDASGNLDLGDIVVGKVLVGFKYTSRLRTLPLEAGSVFGSAHQRVKRVEEVMVKFFRTMHAKVGNRIWNTVNTNYSDELRELNWYNTTAGTLGSGNNPVVEIPVSTKDEVIKMPTGYDRKAQMIVETDRPYPMSVLGVFMRGVTYD